MLDGGFQESNLADLTEDCPEQWSVELDNYDYTDDSDLEDDVSQESVVPSECTQMVEGSLAGDSDSSGAAKVSVQDNFNEFTSSDSQMQDGRNRRSQSRHKLDATGKC